jgi:hypothetical protein
MIGFNFLFLGWIMFDISLTDLLDLRYNQERVIKLIPGLDICWANIKGSIVLTVLLSWLNLEFAITAFSFDYYQDKLEELIEDLEKQRKEVEDEEE